jgi:DNA-binding transcriptional MocR family regulator
VAARPPLLTPARAIVVEPGTRDISQANPDPELLPDLGRALRSIAANHVLYGEPTLDPAMAELAAAWLRDVLAEHDAADTEICLSGGALDGIERILRARTRANDEVAVEDPCYSGVLDLVRGIGLRPVPVGMDQDGPLAEDLANALNRGVRIAILTPRAQNPTGAALTEHRAGRLRQVLRRHPEAHIVENDYLADLSGVPYVGLSAGRPSWTVVRSFSKALGPDLRIAVLAGDRRTVSRVQGHQHLGTDWVSHILQRIAVNVMADPATGELLDRARSLYSERRDYLIAALAAQGIPAVGRSGLNVMVPVVEEVPVMQALRRAGWEVRAGERHRIESGPFIRVTSATLNRADATSFAADLAAALLPGTVSHSA